MKNYEDVNLDQKLLRQTYKCCCFFQLCFFLGSAASVRLEKVWARCRESLRHSFSLSNICRKLASAPLVSSSAAEGFPCDKAQVHSRQPSDLAVPNAPNGFGTIWHTEWLLLPNCVVPIGARNWCGACTEAINWAWPETPILNVQVNT